MKKCTLSLVIVLFLLSIIHTTKMNAEYPRKVLFEEFTEVWCGPCAALAPMLHAWLENHKDIVIPVTYTSYFVIDGVKNKFSENDYKARNEFYTVPFYPYAVLNAVNAPNQQYPGYPTDTSKINLLLDTLTKTSPVKIELEFINNKNSGNVNVKITSDIALQNKQLYVLLVDKHYKYPKETNGMTDYHFIMRKMLPDGNGTSFSINAGQTKDFEFDFTIDFEYMNYDFYATAVVQDINTKYVYQSETIFKEGVNSIKDEMSIKNSELNVFPNPSNGIVELRLPNPNESIKLIELIDVNGQIINSMPLNEDRINNLSFDCVAKDNSNIVSGVYIIKTYTDKSIYYSKVIINR